jgi:hypothetical protein
MMMPLAVACASGGTPTPVGDAPVTEDVAKRLLTQADISTAGGDTGGLDQLVDDIFAVASAVDDTVAETTEALWNVRWIGSGRAGVLMTVTRFYDAADAHDALDQIEIGVAYTAMANPIGDRAALSPANPDVGVAVTFVHGRTLVALQLPVASDGSTLLDEPQLLALAKVIDAKL